MGFQAKYLNSLELRSLGIGSVGENVLISEYATIVGIENLTIGNNVRIDSYVVILSKRGKCSIGSNVHIEPASSLVAHFGIEIGNFCTLSHGVRLFTASADYSGEYLTNVFPESKYQKPISGKITLQDHVILGGNSVVMPNVEIGEGAAIGALSFVRHDVEGWRIYGGNPLRVLADRNKRIKELGQNLLIDLENK